MASDGAIFVRVTVLDSAGGCLTETGWAAELSRATVVRELASIAAIFHAGALNKAASGWARVIFGTRLGFPFDTNPIRKGCYNIVLGAAVCRESKEGKC